MYGTFTALLEGCVLCTFYFPALKIFMSLLGFEPRTFNSKKKQTTFLTSPKSTLHCVKNRSTVSIAMNNTHLKQKEKAKFRNLKTEFWYWNTTKLSYFYPKKLVGVFVCDGALGGIWNYSGCSKSFALLLCKCVV